MKRILGLWIVDYVSGSNSDFFEKAIRNLGYELDIVPITYWGSEAQLLKTLNQKKCDILFHVPYRNLPRSDFLKSICREKKIKTIAWNGDDEWLWSDKDGTAKIAAHYDYCITSTPDAIEKYHAVGQKNVILGQWGYSEDWTKKKVKKEYDVYFCGQKNDIRDGYLNYILERGINLKFDGPGYREEKTPYLEMIQNYRKAKIALNFVNGQRGNFFYQQVKCRNFEVPAVGTFMLSQWCPRLDQFFESGKEIETFKAPEELVRKIEFYLKNAERREKIAAAGHKRNKPNSFENILKGIFDQIGI